MITFTSDRDGDFEVFVMRADGTNQTQRDRQPRRRRRLQRLVARRREDRLQRARDFDVLTMNADGSDKVSLTKGPAFDIDPDWQPLPDGD